MEQTANPHAGMFELPDAAGTWFPASAVPDEPVTEADIERDPEVEVFWREMQQEYRADMEKEQQLARSLGFAHAFVDPGLMHFCSAEWASPRRDGPSPRS